MREKATAVQDLYRATLLLAVVNVLGACGAADDQSPGETGSEVSAPTEVTMMQLSANGFTFDARVAGPEDGPLVFMLHGFPQSSFEWRRQMPAVAELGFRVVAPDQRGYSAGARPDEVSAYAVPNLVQDIVAMADVLGHETFHVVGHDWGAIVTWYLGLTHPERVLSLVPISVPHPTAFGQLLADPNSDQARRSGYMNLFRADTAEAMFLQNDAAFLRGIYGGAGLSADEVQEYVTLLSEPGALTGALNWYRAMNLPSGGSGPALTPISMPTLFIWSDADVALGREGAEMTGDFVEGPYRFEILEGVSHWVPEEAPDAVNQLLVEHFTAFAP